MSPDLTAAVFDLDRVFGDGFGKANPAIVVAYMQATGAFLLADAITGRSDVPLADTIGTALDGIAKAIKDRF